MCLLENENQKENNEINNEIIKKNDIYLGNENDSDIQRQPYILIKQRRPLIEVVDMARLEGVSEEDIKARYKSGTLTINVPKKQKEQKPSWEMVDPKPPVVQCGHLEKRKEH